MLGINGDTLKQWVAIAVIPVLLALFKFISDRSTYGLAKQGEWRKDVETMKGSWKDTWDALSHRVKMAEEAEMECEKERKDMAQRQDTQEERIARLEGGMEEMTRTLHKKNEAIQVLELENADLEKENARLRAGDENGRPR